MMGRRVFLAAMVLVIAAGVVLSDDDFLQKPADTAIRLMVYNPYWNSIFTRGVRRYDKSNEFSRILKAVKPDIVCLQEIGPDRDRADVLDIFADTLPLSKGNQWHIASGADNVIVSRFPIRWYIGEYVHGRGSRGRGHVVASVDLPDTLFAHDLVLANAHFVSGGSRDQIDARTIHGDALVAHVRLALSAHDESVGSPIILVGDFNAYETDSRRHITTLRTGDIVDEETYGDDGSLDPGGQDLVDLLPSHNGTGGERWTWRDDTQQFDPYSLDRIMYTGSILNVIHGFVLNTAAMDPARLEAAGLQEGDVALDLSRGHFDHLPLVADFVLN